MIRLSHAVRSFSHFAGYIFIKSTKKKKDSRTACEWQLMIDDQNRMMSQFKAAMAKLQLLGQDTSKLIDCSDVSKLSHASNPSSLIFNSYRLSLYPRHLWDQSSTQLLSLKRISNRRCGASQLPLDVSSFEFQCTELTFPVVGQ